MNKLPQIQVCRGIAVLLVTFYHSYIGVRYFPDTHKIDLPFVYSHGYLGVNLFFCISGLIIGMVADKGSFSIGGFLLKRVFRIYPLYWAILLVAAWLTIKPLPDLVGVLQDVTLYPVKGEPYYAVSWSLQYEVIFYLMAALLIPFIGVTGLAILLVVLGVVGVASPVEWDYHLLSARQFEFAGGLLLYRFKGHLSRAGVLPPLAASFVMYYLATIDTPYASLAGALLLLLGFLNIREEAAKKWFAPFIWIGNISYSLYLVHWLVVLKGNEPAVWLHGTPWQAPDWIAEPYRLAMIAVAIALSYVVYRVIELPMVDIGHRLSSRRTTVRVATP